MRFQGLASALFWILSLWVSPTGAVSVASQVSREEDSLPFPWNAIVSPRPSGTLVKLPFVDTDPNRGLTYGVMPVWVAMGKNSQIRNIHIFTATYNQYVGLAAGYEQYFFPSLGETVHFQASSAEKYERGVMAGYSNDVFSGHVEYSRDGSMRFFGLGPNAPQSAESNYTLDSLNYDFSGTFPFWKDSPFQIGFKHSFQANKVSAGAITQPDDLVNVYPTVAAQTHPRRRDADLRAFFSYDTRDSVVTTSRGSFGQIFLGGARDGLLGQYGYYNYGLRLKHFIPWFHRDEQEPKFISAFRFRWENLQGDAPFWRLPQVGGKYWHRGYGEGRFTDHGLILLGAEQRCRIFARKIGGMTTSFWADPFLDMGTVFPYPDKIQIEHVRPTPGFALRAVGRPQIVGSADFGFGAEGLKVFLDIDYAF